MEEGRSEEKKASTARRQLRRIPRHVRVYVLSFSLGKILSYKSIPAEKLFAREKQPGLLIVADRPTFAGSNRIRSRWRAR